MTHHGPNRGRPKGQISGRSAGLRQSQPILGGGPRHRLLALGHLLLGAPDRDPRLVLAEGLRGWASGEVRGRWLASPPDQQAPKRSCSA